MARTPAGSSDRPAASAFAAPASTRSVPSGARAPAIHRLRAERPSGAGRNQVQRAPCSSAARGCGTWPTAIAIAQPAWVAIWAATSLVRMPPEEYPGGGSPPIASISGVSAATTGICAAAGSRRGSAVYSPSMSDSRISWSACTISATRAASRSLSPKRISAVAIESFSLMTGMQPSPSSVVRVERALR